MWESFELLVIGAGMTLVVSAVSIAIGVVLGVFVCSATLARAWPLRWLGALYISFFRGVPLLVQLLMIYHVLPEIGIDVPGIVAAIAGLALCTAAYQAENLRGGFLNISTGLVEAAQMVGLSKRQILLRIRLPIAVRLVLPTMINEAILTLKASSLVSVVGVGELTRSAQNLAASNFEPLQMYSMAGALYLVLNILLAGGGSAFGRFVGRSA